MIARQWQDVAKKALISEGDELRLSDGHAYAKGKRCWVSISACPIDIETENNNSGKMILISDITQTRSLQNEFNRQQRLSSLGEMIAGLAH